MPKFTITKAIPKIKPILLSLMLSIGLVPQGTRVAAEAVISCDLAVEGQEFSNTAIADYNQQNVALQILSNRQTVNSEQTSQQTVRVVNRGIENEAGNVVGVLGAIASNLGVNLAVEQSTADVAGITAIAQ